MPKDVFWFKHDANAHSDLKIKAMRRQYGWEGFGWYWLIIGLLRSEDGYKLEYNDLTFGSLAEDMGCEESKAKQFIDDCINAFKLFSKNGDHFYSDRLCRDMGLFTHKSELARTAAGIRWGNKKEAKSIEAQSTSNADAVGTHSEGNARREDKEDIYNKIDKGGVGGKDAVASLDKSSITIQDDNLETINKGVVESPAKVALIKRFNDRDWVQSQIDKLRGGRKLPGRTNEKYAITRMLNHPYAKEDIVFAFKKLAEDSYWQENELYMQSVEKQISKILDNRAKAPTSSVRYVNQ